MIEPLRNNILIDEKNGIYEIITFDGTREPITKESLEVFKSAVEWLRGLSYTIYPENTKCDRCGGWTDIRFKIPEVIVIDADPEKCCFSCTLDNAFNDVFEKEEGDEE